MPTNVTTLRIVPAVDRAARILDVLARESRDWTLSELAQVLGVHKGTTRVIQLTLHRHGITDIKTSKDAAEALRPLAGKFAAALFALGVVGVGFLAIPTLTGSAAYALAETFGFDPVRWGKKR